MRVLLFASRQDPFAIRTASLAQKVQGPIQCIISARSDIDTMEQEAWGLETEIELPQSAGIPLS